MSKKNVIRAWKDAAFRGNLSQEEQAAMPANPAGVVDLSDVQQSSVNGGNTTIFFSQWYNCMTHRPTCQILCRFYGGDNS